MKLLNNLILKFSPGLKEEQKALQQWKENYLQEIEALQQLHPGEGLSDKAEKYKDFDPGKAWKKIEPQLQEASIQPKVFQMQSYLKYAAIFVLALAALLFWQNSASIDQGAESYLAEESELQVELPDKSVVLLQPKTKLTQSSLRHIVLDGRGVFDIEKNPAHPFIIETHQAQVKVLGTSFDLISSPDSTWIDVTEGRVELTWEQGSRILVAGDKATIKKNKLVFFAKGQALILDWEHNILNFDNIELSEALKIIADHFNMKINWPKDESGKSCLIRTKFQNATLTNVLKELSLISNFEFEIKEQTINITRMGC